ncbi:hypothetical protein GPJ56_002988 [Histomonas meleagridis]|uniref:uncharacterized protein n=1 Tax=Histomonas meleagridis TaxID=135588 RepID=UPI003559737A|nr:hypothetical protein GPJ56_002988 [Histomonas meleagridis]KAH0796645.1 hypothetical protein GO595_010538 [Histomonas meleagridis]
MSEEEKKAEERKNHSKEEIIEIFKTTTKNCYAPIVEDKDSTDPRVSKFGGRAPYLPKDGKIHKCPDCGEPTSLVFSLYVPTLPEEIQNYFPEDERESVVAGFSCEYCYEGQHVIRYRGSEINELLYDEIDEEHEFNEHRVVTKWEQQQMIIQDTDSLVEIHPELTQDDIDLINDMIVDTDLEDLRKKPPTYLGGWADFVQGNDQPEGTVLLLEMEESEASTNTWGDAGTAQVWMTTGDDFGDFTMRYSCC